MKRDLLIYLVLLASAILKAFAVSIVPIQQYTSYIITILSLFFILTLADDVKYNKLNRIMFIYILLITFSWIIQYDRNTLDLYLQLNAYLLPNLLWSSYLFFRKYPYYYSYFKIIGIPIVVAAFWNVIRLSTYINQWNPDVTLQSNSGNLLVALIPFCLFYNNKIIRYALWALIFVGVCISIKRSAFIIFSVCFIFANIIGNQSLKGKKALTLIIVCASIVLFFLVAPYIDVFSNLMGRLMEATNDGGSGRDALFSMAFEMYGKASFIELLFGNGYLSAAEDYKYYFGMKFSSTHNDFTEILYDGGLLSLIVFISILVILYKKTKIIFNNTYVEINFSTITAICLVTILIASMLVSTYIHFWYYLPLYCVYGGAISCAEKLE